MDRPLRVAIAECVGRCRRPQWLWLWLFCALSAAAGPIEEPAGTSPVVLTLTDANWQATRPHQESAAALVVLVYAPWCGHCKRITPEFGEAARRVSASGTDHIRFATLDATVETATARALRVRSYPLLLHISGAATARYDAPPCSADALEQFMKDPGVIKQRPTVGDTLNTSGLIVLDDQSIEQALSDHELLMVMFYAPWCKHCKTILPEYRRAARILRQDGSAVSFAVIDAEQADASARKHDVRHYPTLRTFAGGVGVAVYGENLAGTAAAIRDYIHKHEQEFIDSL